MIAQDTATKTAAPIASEVAPGDGARPDADKRPPMQEPSGVMGRTLARLLSLSLFYKVLIANSAIVLLGAVVGTFITQRITSAQPNQSWDFPLVCIFAGAGILLT
ncbi:MAG TPA: hypothetical protein VMV29_00640, partial [Ktedonobacterales bacterium]|nr:hypothetical protein [Ktedonobacterales bacterium]